MQQATPDADAADGTGTTLADPGLTNPDLTVAGTAGTRQASPDLTNTHPDPAADIPSAPAIPPLPEPITPDHAVALVEEARRVVAAARQDVQQGRFKGLTYSQALQKRMTAQRLLRKQKGRTAAPAIRPDPAEQPAA